MSMSCSDVTDFQAVMPPDNWLVQLGRQCAGLAAHPQLNVKEVMYAIGSLLSKIQQSIDEDRLNAGLVESLGKGMMQLADKGIVQQQARQLIAIPFFRAEALQQLPPCFAPPPDETKAQTLERLWDEHCAESLEPLLKSLLQTLLVEHHFFDPRCSFGEMFARLSRYLFWIRHTIALEVQAGSVLTAGQQAEWRKTFHRHSAAALARGDDERLTSDFYLLKGLALL